MKSFISPLRPANASTGALPATLNLDEPNAVLRARVQPLAALALHIDCARLTCQRTLGVGYVVSQLLLLHRTGARVWLRNVNAPLRRCLHLLGLNGLFQFEEAR
jgi:anti-anti-sigma regulatory factor